LSFSLLAFAGAAYAQQSQQQQSQQSNQQQQSNQEQQPPRQSFRQLDKDGDGFLGMAEAAADTNATSRFRELDRNGDYKLSQQEYQSGQQGSQSASSGASGKSQKQDKQSQPQGEMRASQLIGSKVMDKQGNELGKIEDVVLDLQGGKVHAAVLEFGGIAGMGEKSYAFPISDLQPAKGNKQFTMNIDKEKLKNAQGFAKGQWPEMDDEYWGKVGGQASAGGTQQSMTLVRASELKGKSITDPQGEDVGEIRDAVIDLKSGRLQNLLIDAKDAGQARVPAKSITKGTGDQFVLSGMTAEELRSQAKKSGKQPQQQQGGKQ
jgi:sporulation protein YlmC with PRC-barrel domain